GGAVAEVEERLLPQSLGAATASGSAWRVCGGSERSRLGGTRRGRRSARVVGADRASEYASGERTASRPFCAGGARSGTRRSWRSREPDHARLRRLSA